MRLIYQEIPLGVKMVIITIELLVWDKDWNMVHNTQDFHFLGTQIDPTTGMNIISSLLQEWHS